MSWMVCRRSSLAEQPMPKKAKQCVHCRGKTGPANTNRWIAISSKAHPICITCDDAWWKLRDKLVLEAWEKYIGQPCPSTPKR